MKKIFLIFAIASAAISCSDDDNNKTPEPPAMLLTHFTTTSETNGFNLNYMLTYDEQQRLQQFIKTGDVSATLIYHYNDANMVSRIDVVEINNEYQIVFAYDSQNHLTSFTKQGVTTAVVYDTASRTYTIGGIELQLNEAGDILSTNVLKFTYAGLGTFASVNGPNIKLINNLVDGMFIFVGSRNAIESIKDYEGNDVYEITNTLNESGYPSKVVIDSQIDDIMITAELEYEPI